MSAFEDQLDAIARFQSLHDAVTLRTQALETNAFLDSARQMGTFVEEAREAQRFAKEVRLAQRFAEEGRLAKRFIEEARETQRFAEEAQELQRFAQEAREAERFAKEAQEAQRFAGEIFSTQRFVEEAFDAQQFMTVDYEAIAAAMQPPAGPNLADLINQFVSETALSSQAFAEYLDYGRREDLALRLVASSINVEALYRDRPRGEPRETPLDRSRAQTASPSQESLVGRGPDTEFERIAASAFETLAARLPARLRNRETLIALSKYVIFVVYHALILAFAAASQKTAADSLKLAYKADRRALELEAKAAKPSESDSTVIDLLRQLVEQSDTAGRMRILGCSTSLRAGPGHSSVTIARIRPGLEVLVRETAQGWALVEYEDPTSRVWSIGWIPETCLRPPARH